MSEHEVHPKDVRSLFFAQRVAHGTTAGLGRSHESPTDDGGAGSPVGDCGTRSTLQRGSLDAPDGETLWIGINVAGTWRPKGS